MPRGKRKATKENPPTAQKRVKIQTPSRRSTRTAAHIQAPRPADNTQNSSKAEEVIDVVSESSSLSDPPSRISTPDTLRRKNETGKTKRARGKKTTEVKKVSIQEHEEALDKFIREDEGSDESSELDEKVPQSGNRSDDDGDGEDWEDVHLMHPTDLSFGDGDGPADLEITLERTQQSMRLKNKGSSAAEKKIRMHTHLLHVQCLLAHGAIRNSWLNDKQLQEILLSKFSKSRGKWKDEIVAFSSQKDHLVTTIRGIADTFRKEFKITKPGLRKMGYRDLSMIDKEADEKFYDQFEQFQNVEEFREQAKTLSGSRDFGAQLFTALLRALNPETRLIFSLQPLGFNFGKFEDAHRLDRKKDDLSQPIPSTSTSSPISGPSTPQTTKKRKRQRDEDSELEDLGLPKVKRKTEIMGPDSDLKFPVFWSEVYVEGTWIPIDSLVLRLVAVRSDDLEKFEPRGKQAEEKKQVMGYVVAYDSERYARDVTVRYVKNFPGKAKRWRIREFSVRGWDGQMVMYDWFKRTLGIFRRTEKNERDLSEDVQLSVRPPSPKEVNLDSLSYYKNHPEYVLERHLRREEALRSDAEPVRKFTSGKGDKAKEEVVYNRSDVYICRTVENWYKEGKKVKEGKVSMKQVKARPMTLARRREHELAMAENDDQPVMEGLYAAHQVEIYIPPPIEGGIIPKNAYGNIDLFVDTMLPAGSVHLPHRGIAKVAKKLGIEYAEAVTSFEFKKQRAIPVISGIVVEAGNEEIILDAWRAEEHIRVEKEASKKQREILGRWKKFLVGLRIRERVNSIYGSTTAE